MLFPTQSHIVPLRFPTAIKIEKAQSVSVFYTKFLKKKTLDSVPALRVTVNNTWAVEDQGFIVADFYVRSYWDEEGDTDLGTSAVDEGEVFAVGVEF